MSLRGGRINDFLESWCLVASEKVLISVKIWIFDDTYILQKGTCIGHFGARDDPTIRISIFFAGMGL